MSEWETAIENLKKLKTQTGDTVDDKLINSIIGLKGADDIVDLVKAAIEVITEWRKEMGEKSEHETGEIVFTDKPLETRLLDIIVEMMEAVCSDMQTANPEDSNGAVERAEAIETLVDTGIKLMERLDKHE